MITSFDDTTTRINYDDDEDKTQFLDGQERLRYFSTPRSPLSSPLKNYKRGWLTFFTRFWK